MWKRTSENKADVQKCLTFALLASSAAVAWPSIGAAQQPASGPSSAQSASSQVAGTEVSEIVVTAEKRPQRLVDVPASISVLTSKDIANDTIIALSGIAARAPNVVMSGSSLFPGIVIRGVGSSSGTQTGVDPAAVVYVDGVYQGRERAENIPLLGVDQIEVLRGPQGTLYGANTIGGAINITTEKPTDRPTAEADLLAGNLGFVQATGLVSGPIVEDKVFASLSAIYRHRNGWIDDAYNGDKLNYDNATGARLRVIYDAAPHLTFDLGADYLHETDTESLLTTSYAAIPFPPFSTLTPPDPQNRTEYVNSPESGGRDVYGASIQADYDFPGVRFTSISSYRAYTSAYAFDSDGTPLSVDSEDDTDDANLFTQEVRLTSTNSSPLQWIVGAFYLHQRLVDAFTTDFLDQFPTVLLGAPPLPAGYFSSDTSYGHIIDDSYAAFASATYAITSRLSVTGGVRLTIDSKHLIYNQLSGTPNAQPFDISSLVEATVPTRRQRLNETVPTGDVSLTYKFSPDQAAYIKFSRGYKAGGFNAYITTLPYDPAQSLAFQPEYLDNYEIGFKGSWFDNRVTFSSSLFYDDYTNKQEAVEDPLALSITIRNAAKATIYGAELEGSAEPIRGLTFSGTVGLLHARYSSFPNGGGIGISYSGNSLPDAPPVQATLAVQYEHELPVGNGLTGVARLEAIYSGASFSDPNNTLAYRQSPVTFLNGRLGIQAQRWGLFLWANNLTNDLHLSGGLYELVATARAVNIPRNFGVELRFKY